MAGIVGTLAAALIAFAVLAVLGYLLPNWLILVSTLAFAKGLVALGIVALMRGGLVSFGQGTFYCAGAYAAGLAMHSLGVADAAVLVALGAVAALILGLLIAPLLAGYRGIFFATLTLALSMIVYGILNKTYSLGGSDGFNLHAPTFFGYHPSTPHDVELCAVSLHQLRDGDRRGAVPHPFRFSFAGCFRWPRATMKFASNIWAPRYAGSAAQTSRLPPSLPASAAHCRRFRSAISIPISPSGRHRANSSSWRSSAAMSASPRCSSPHLELVLFSSQYFPNTWQGALGIFLLLIILFLPEGLGPR